MKATLVMPFVQRMKIGKRLRIRMRWVAIAAVMREACKSAPDRRPEWTTAATRGGMIGDVTMTVVIAAFICNNKAAEEVVTGDASDRAPFFLLKKGRNF
jgi:hypothetical protein